MLVYTVEAKVQKHTELELELQILLADIHVCAGGGM